MRKFTIMLFLVTMAVSVGPQAWGQQSPRMKMTTDVPPGIATPDELETHLGTLTIV